MTGMRRRVLMISVVVALAGSSLLVWILRSRYVACLCIRNDQSSPAAINVEAYGSLNLRFDGVLRSGEEQCVPGDYQRHRNGPDFGGVRVTADDHVAQFELPPFWGLNPRIRATRDRILLDRRYTVLPRVLPCR